MTQVSTEFNFKTNDLNLASFLKTKGWVIQSTADKEGSRIKDIVFQVPGWETVDSALLEFKANSSVPAQTLLKNYHYVKNLVTKRDRNPEVNGNR